MKINIRNINGNYILDIFTSKIDDFFAKILRKMLLDLIKTNRINIYINFSSVESINPDILGTIMAANRSCISRGGRISVFGLNPDMLLIFHIIQFDKYINLYTNEYDALKNKNLLVKRRLKVVK